VSAIFNSFTDAFDRNPVLGGEIIDEFRHRVGANFPSEKSEFIRSTMDKMYKGGVSKR